MSAEIGVGFGPAQRVARRPDQLELGASREPFNWPLVLLAYAVVCVIAIVKTLHGLDTTPLLKDTDDAMRLVTVRDLLAGQNWFDHTQYRLNTPYGAEIHWSHLVDAGIGAVILLLRPLAGALTETVAVCVWPLLLLLPLMVLSGRLAFRLVGRAGILPAVVLTPLSLAMMAEFTPGRIDHDSVQILLLLSMLWGAIGALERERFGWLAGIAAAVSLAIGIEGLPSVVAAVLAFALMWVARPERAGAMRAFGLGFGIGTPVMLMLAYQPSHWLVPAVDEISIVYAAFAAGAGAILTALSLLPLAARAPWQRLALGVVLGAVLGLAIVIAFPIVLGGPYASLDPWLVKNWLSNIGEAETMVESVRGFDAFSIGAIVPVFLALIAIGFRVLRGEAEGRDAWLILGLFLLIAVAVMCVEIRGASMAGALIAPSAAWVILKARNRYLLRDRLSGALGLIGSWFGFAGLPVALVAVLLSMPFGGNQAAAASKSTNACLMPQAFAPLAALPPARTMSLIDLGSHTLLYTRDSVVAAPYHRDQQGLLDAFHFFDGPIAAGRDILSKRGVSLVVVCPGMAEMAGLPSASPDSFVKLYAANKLPAWLDEVSAPGSTLRIYRVLPQ